MVMRLVSRLSLANHSDSESFLFVHALFSQDGWQREGFYEAVGHVVSPFDLSRTLLVGGGLLVPYSLSGSPVIKQLMQMVTMVPGQVRGTAREGLSLGSCSALCRALGHVPKLPVPPP